MRRLIEQTRFTRGLSSKQLGERAETAFSRTSNLISINMQILPSRAPQHASALCIWIAVHSHAQHLGADQTFQMLCDSTLLCKIAGADCYLRRHLEKISSTANLHHRAASAASMGHEGHNGAAFPLADRVTAKD